MSLLTKMYEEASRTDLEKGVKRMILKNGKIGTTLKDGTFIINGHVKTVNGRDIFVINGYEFKDLSGFNVTQDLRGSE
jgi:hypothetical protein